LVDWGLDGIAAAANFTENIFIMKATTFSILMALVALAFVRPAHPTSFVGYVSFRGSKQGQIKGESKGKGGREDKGFFQIQSFDMAGEVPVDASKPGAAQGKRTHKPFSITKETDGASPQLLQAHYTNEVFDNVVIQTLDDNNKVSRTITLTNAVISDLRKSGTIEAISFTYEKIESQQ
jgi:type VI secretion system Hcp family effector